MSSPAVDRPSAARAAVWVLLLVTALGGLSGVGHGAVDGPEWQAPASWWSWAASQDTLTVVFALLRAATVMTGWYLLGATLLMLAVHARPASAPARAVRAVTLRPARDLLAHVVGITVAMGPAPAAASAALPPPVVTVVETTPAPSVLPPPVFIDDEPPQPRDRSSHSTGPGRVTHAPTWTVRPGDHFWSIAERVLPDDIGERAVARYWRRLIAANRSRLVDPANADLLLPGQVLRLPRR